MNAHKAQIIWGSIVAATFALLALHNIFGSRPLGHVFFNGGSPSTSVNSAFEIR